MNPSSFTPGASAEGPDKVDMSLDDIIRLNKKQKQLQSHKSALKKHKLAVRGRLNQGMRMTTPLQRGGGAGKLFVRGQKFVPPPGGKRRGQGVITGLAARKTALLKGVSPLNRPALNRMPRNRRTPSRLGNGRVTVNHSAFPQRTRPFVAQRESQRRQTYTQRWPYTQRDTQKAPPHMTRRPFQLHRKWNGPPVHESHREARQATFLSRRGLKVQTHVQKTAPSTQRTQRTRPWRTPQNNTGILTVSIDNPTARTQPEPAHSWSLHPSTPAPPPTPAEEPERKPPKGVALQFDINSVGKQTTMTLNERFRILKDKRIAASKQSSKGGRFVTVG
ncbi:UAP56-interacting factor isoform X2 [Astyanax mexicanus]|uniref:UAP56-interacting factor n=1 Tax=Astyanax mexicanus TaxID=7994 RepID=A0A8B9J608_ASTMX|nr:UAP56-interacting factor isoform X2 [Astyanax mexicanus]